MLLFLFRAGRSGMSLKVTLLIKKSALNLALQLSSPFWLRDSFFFYGREGMNRPIISLIGLYVKSSSSPPLASAHLQCNILIQYI